MKNKKPKPASRAGYIWSSVEGEDTSTVLQGCCICSRRQNSITQRPSGKAHPSMQSLSTETRENTVVGDPREEARNRQIGQTQCIMDWKSRQVSPFVHKLTERY